MSNLDTERKRGVQAFYAMDLTIVYIIVAVLLVMVLHGKWDVMATWLKTVLVIAIAGCVGTSVYSYFFVDKWPNVDLRSGDNPPENSASTSSENAPAGSDERSEQKPSEDSQK